MVEALFCEPGEAANDEKEEKPKRPVPKNKRVVAHLSQGVGEEEIKASTLTFDWISQQIKERGLAQLHLKEAAPPEPKIHIFLSDGQPSLWAKAEELKKEFPDRRWIEILDLMHANSYLWEAAAVFYPGDNEEQLIFMKERILRLLQGKVDVVISALRQMATKREIKKSSSKIIDKMCRYFEHNRTRMKYDEYLAMGCPIASGVIEGACRHFVKDRMERAGMRWSVQGAQAMLNMRSVNLNGNMDEFTRYRIEQQTKKLYSYMSTVEAIAWPIAA